MLYITAIGLYQPFIQETRFPSWLKVDSTEELEINLIGVTVVAPAVNFLGVVFAREQGDLLNYSAGIGLPIAALVLLLGARAKQWPGASSRRRMSAARQSPGRSSAAHSLRLPQLRQPPMTTARPPTAMQPLSRSYR